MICLLQESATKRLLKDLKEIERSMLATICARLLDYNLFKWHANLLAPKRSLYYGCMLHLQIIFTSRYLHMPFKVRLITPISYKYMFDRYICLNMLKTHHSQEPYYGWSSSYIVLSILMQLQSFLCDETYTGVSEKYFITQNSICNALNIKCTCGHNALKNPWPVESSWNLSDIMLNYRCNYSFVRTKKIKLSNINKSTK
jgi:ubiquitin-protein ligase